MAKNVIFEDGDNLSLPVIAGTVSGSPVIVGMIPGVALTDRRADGTASVQTKGVVSVSVTTAAAVAVGAPIYITSASYALSDAAGTGKQLYGHAVSASTGTGAKTLNVRIAQFAVATDAPA